MNRNPNGAFIHADDVSQWRRLWKGMPEFIQENQNAWKSVEVIFRNPEDFRKFTELTGCDVSHDRWTWFPCDGLYKINKRFCWDGEQMLPRHPIYVISKGRWDTRCTSRYLERMKVPYRIVIEPQEFIAYSSVIDPSRILVLPFSNLGQGSIPARNWVWEHSLKNGDERHWILDDNIKGFYRINRNEKLLVNTGAAFSVLENFVDRWENVGLAGLNYETFMHKRIKRPAFILNTRVYSCILIRNDLGLRWRGRYNEDTDLSLRVLKSGLCTVLFNAFLAKKEATMRMKGGNTDELYQGDGRKLMAESLVAQHPTVAKTTFKWNRFQHTVNYKVFRSRLIPKTGTKFPDGIDEHGLRRVGQTRPLLPGNVKPLLVGEASKEGPPFKGRPGRFLARLIGLSLDEFLSMVEAANLLPAWPGKDGKGDAFPKKEATANASKISLRNRHAILAGKRVAAAFGIKDATKLKPARHRGGIVLVIPHPSGINLWWNDDDNKAKAAKALRRFLKDAGLRLPPITKRKSKPNNQTETQR